jgi:DNA-binding protein HU-beta
MKKNDFIKEVLANLPEDLKLSQKSLNELLDITFDTLTDVVVKNEKFIYPGFGTFTLKARAARDGINPKTKEKIKIEASKSIGFKPATKLKEKLN